MVLVRNVQVKICGAGSLSSAWTWTRYRRSLGNHTYLINNQYELQPGPLIFICSDFTMLKKLRTVDSYTVNFIFFVTNSVPFMKLQLLTWFLYCTGIYSIVLEIRLWQDLRYFVCKFWNVSTVFIYFFKINPLLFFNRFYIITYGFC